jgi:hypothetical protein
MGLLPPDPDDSPWAKGAVTFVAFVLFGSVPLISYIAANAAGAEGTLLFGLCVIGYYAFFERTMTPDFLWARLVLCSRTQATTSHHYYDLSRVTVNPRPHHCGGVFVSPSLVSDVVFTRETAPPGASCSRS